ncbi:serine hydrolase domain-containing protein [Paenibacillus soyae]|uniref:Beta-lactamase family protein n=1 Tax=Paenibacillus soyae TaxID=2969249 RepID=A0A9X2MRQ6_9BACL|nr:serine hydrolase domain-containing protein [Paenibacillus soyae]MCR2802752.1 beta-lactamase family protein [Paenibacillus soyae]
MKKGMGEAMGELGLTREWRVIEGLIDASPGAVGMDPSQLNKLDRHFKALQEDGKIQGAGYIVSRHGQIVACRTMGPLTGTTGEGEFRPDSLRKLSSITKAFTSVAVAKLIEDGMLYADQPVSSILGEFDNPTHGGITIFHLLTHTSGLMPVPGYYNEPYPRERRGKDSVNDWIREALQGTPVCKPGEAYNYSAEGFKLLGEIIGRVSGMPYEQYVKLNLLQPLGLNHTFFRVPEHLRAKVMTVDQHDLDSLALSREAEPGSPPHSDSGLYSTMYDLWKFGQMLLNGGRFGDTRILGRKTVELLTKRHLFQVPAFHWGGEIRDKGHALGLDLAIDHMSFESIGTYQLEGAGRSALFVDPAEQMVVVLFVPSIYSWIPHSILGTKQIIWSSLI